MEYRNKVTLQIGVLGVLVITAVLGFVFSGQAVNQRQSVQPLFEGLLPEGISSLEIKNQVTLTKKEDGGWQVLVGGKTYPGSEDRITGYLQTLLQQKRERLASSSGDLASFGLDKDFKEILGHDKAGRVVFDLQVGKPDSTGRSIFVKLQGTKEIWQTDRGFAQTLDLDFNTWTDLSLVRGLKPEDIIRVTFDGTLVTKDKKIYKAFDLVKGIKDGKAAWQNKPDGTFPKKAEIYGEQVAFQKANAYLKPDESFDPVKAVATLTLEARQGKVTLKFGTPDALGRFPVAEGERRLWVNDFQLDQVLYVPDGK